MVYLNSACLNAIAEYLAVRPEPPKDADKPYLFVSSRTRAPLTHRRVEQIVETHLKAAGLGGRAIPLTNFVILPPLSCINTVVWISVF